MVNNVALQQEGPRFDSQFNQGCLSVKNLYILPVHVWVSAGSSGFILQFKNMQVNQLF